MNHYICRLSSFLGRLPPKSGRRVLTKSARTRRLPIRTVATVTIGLSLFAPGCARFQDRPLDPGKSAAAIEARTLTRPDLLQFIDGVIAPYPGQQVRTWNLDRLTLAAWYYHPDLAFARAQAETARAAITTAGQRPNPNFVFTPTWVRNIAAGVSPWIIGSALNIPLETAGKRDYRIVKAERLEDAAHLRIVEAAWLTRSRLRAAMLEVFAAHETERKLQQQLAIRQSMEEGMERQQSAGEMTHLDVIRSRLLASQLRLDIETQRKRCTEGEVLLATAIGVPVSALKGITLDFSAFNQALDPSLAPVAELRETALRERPDLLAALMDYAAAQAALQLEIANQYPNIQLNPAYTWDLGAHYWTLGASILNLPLFNQNQGPIAEAEAKRHEYAVRFEALQMQILNAIDRAFAGVTAAFVKWRDSGQRLRQQRDSLQMAQAWFQAGETDRLALLGARLEKALADRAHLDVLLETQQALNALEDALRYPVASSLTQKPIADDAMKRGFQ